MRPERADGEAARLAMRRFGRLAPGVWRGSQPDAAGFERLKGLGADTVVCLRTRSRTDRENARRLGLRLVEIPMPPLGAPTMAQGIRFLSEATDPQNGEIFFHCTHGVDRTGAAAAIYRIAVQGWDLDRALAEMREQGAHWYVQHAKVAFVREFAAAWSEIPEAFRQRVLHQGVAGTAWAPAPRLQQSGRDEEGS